MKPDEERISADEARVPAAAPGHMERVMLRLLGKAQMAVEGGVPARVCGLTVVFSLEGNADVTWDIGNPPNEPTM